MPTKIKTKTVVFVAEKQYRYFSDGPWEYFTGVRPGIDRERVESDLRKYEEKHGGGSVRYRVAEYVRNNRAKNVEL